MGLLGCGWADADEIIRRAMVPLAPELDLCAASQGDDAVNWSIVVQVGPRGRVKEAGFSSLLDGAEPPECALEVLAGTRFESGPPTCGAVHWLRFKVDADRGCAGAS